MGIPDAAESPAPRRARMRVELSRCFTKDVYESIEMFRFGEGSVPVRILRRCCLAYCLRTSSAALVARFLFAISTPCESKVIVTKPGIAASFLEIDYSTDRVKTRDAAMQEAPLSKLEILLS